MDGPLHHYHGQSNLFLESDVLVDFMKAFHLTTLLTKNSDIINEWSLTCIIYIMYLKDIHSFKGCFQRSNSEFSVPISFESSHIFLVLLG